jgi:hypothetical protein
MTDEDYKARLIPHEITPREIVGDYAARSLSEGASFAAEGARIVCHHEITQVSTVYAIVAEFYTAAFAMETAAQNMIGDLSRMAAKGDLYDAHPDGDPIAAIEQTKALLALAAAHAGQLGRALQDTQNAIAGVGHREGNEG